MGSSTPPLSSLSIAVTAPPHRESLVRPVKSSNRDTNFIVRSICEGRNVVLEESFHRGLEILQGLEQHMGSLPHQASFSARSVHADKLRTISSRLWVRFEKHRVHLPGVTVGTILETLYPLSSTGYISFPLVRELAGAWKRYTDGIHYPVLGRKLHPFFGVYYPTRTEHLELFATWLSQYKGQKEHCVDVGTGSGILTLLLAKSGFQTIDAIDQNPNAIWSVQEELKRHPMDATIRLHHADLLSPIDRANLIVFNPPWIPGKSHSSVTEALFFTGGLFERFFDQAHKTLSSKGTLVLIFSNILTLLRPDLPHPIETELQRGRFKCIQKMQRKVKPKLGQRTKEKVQIWELERN